jgi:3-isopropylmalate/(R)-2-methylmalate dehydratase small subunit
MEKLVRLEGVAATLPFDNVDTDAIFPARFIQRMDCDYAAALFADWRFRDGRAEEEPGFVLNLPPFRDATILVGGENFGCGSSREHAVWALAAWGVRVVIARSFGDIFRDNCFKNGLLPIALPEHEHDALDAALEASNNKRLTVDLAACAIRAPGAAPIRFAIDPDRRALLMEGLDEIGATLREADAIAAFQGTDRARRPWVWAPVAPR